MSNYHPVEVMGVRVEMPSNQPIVLLKEIEGARRQEEWRRVRDVRRARRGSGRHGRQLMRPLEEDLRHDRKELGRIAGAVAVDDF